MRFAIPRLNEPAPAEHRPGAVRRFFERYLQPVVVTTICLFGFTAVEPWHFAWAGETAARAASAPAETGAAAALERELHAVVQALDGPAFAGGTDSADLAAGVADLDLHLRNLERLRRAIRRDLDATGRWIDEQRLPAEISARHRDAVRRFDVRYGQAEAHLEGIRQAWRRTRDGARDAAAGTAGLRTAIDRARSGLEGLLTAPRHTPIDPEALPLDRATREPVPPRLTARDFAGLRGELGARAAEGRAATVDAPQTAEIVELAASLGNDPRRIYEFVRNRVRFTPTYGSIQGAAGCLATRLCNDADTASLLIALLRAAGVPARYVIGTVEVPIGAVTSWVGGFTDPQAALTLIASAGTPVTFTSDGGEIVAARVEHVWVEARVPYSPSRAAAAVGDDAWIPLAPAFKRSTATGGVDLGAAVTTDLGGLLEDLEASATIDPSGFGLSGIDRNLLEAARSAVAADLEGFLAANLPAEPAVGDLLDLDGVEEQAFGVLPASLPFRVLAQGAAVDELPASMRHRLTVEVSSAGDGVTFDLTHATTLPEVAGKKLTLAYVPASADDEEVLRTLLPEDTGEPIPVESFPTEVPAHLVKVRPELRLEGQTVATGAEVTLGRTGELRLVLSGPNTTTRVVENDLVAGTFNAIVLNLGRVEDPEPRLRRAEEVRDQLAAGVVDGVDHEDLVGEILHGAGLLYWSELELLELVTRQLYPVVTARLPSEGIFTYGLEVELLFGAPHTARSGRVQTDVDTNVQAVLARDGDRVTEIDFFGALGIASSRAESAVWDRLSNEVPSGEGFTAAAVLDAADLQGVPVFHLDGDNLAEALPLLEQPAVVLQDVVDSVNAGLEVTIPQRAVTVGGVTGTGYVAFNPQTGAGGYIISPGLAGGDFQLPSLDPLANALIGIVLLGAGVIASGGLGVALAVAGVAVLAYDFVATVQQINRDNPNLEEEQREQLTSVLAALALAGTAITLIGLHFGGLLGFVVTALFWLFYSIVASLMIQSVAELADRQNQFPVPPTP